MNTLTINKSKEWTVDDYLLLGELPTPCQLINGELFMSPAPSPLHQRILRNLFRILDAAKLPGEVLFAPIDLFVDNHNVFQPDLIYIPDSKKEIITTRGIEGAPSLIIEVISPHNIFNDRNRKKKSYLEFGVEEYWIVDPANETIEIYTQAGGTDVPAAYHVKEGEVVSLTVKDLSFSLEQIFHPAS